jgi:GTP cyclohydrolase II
MILGRRRLESAHGPIEVTFFRDQADGQTAMAMSCGDIRDRSPLLARVHSSCVTSECLMACDCDCAEQLDLAWARIAEAGRGVIFYLMQEGRGAGLTAKARDRMMVQASGHRLTTFDAFAEMGLPADLRRYDAIAPMARALGIRGPLDLLTNNSEKAAGVTRALANEKIEIRRLESVEGPISPFNRDYLRAKRLSGHSLERGASRPGRLPPEPLEVEAPQRAARQPHLISTARYFLPISLARNPDRDESVDWFRMRVVYDSRTARESVLLSRGDAIPRRGGSLVLTLVDRLPSSQARRRRALRTALLEIRESGEGAIVLHFDDSNPNADLDSTPQPDSQMRSSEEILAAEWIPAEEWGAALDAER